MFHIPAHKQVAVVAIPVSLVGASVASRHAVAEYCAAYAQWAPIMRARWAGRNDPAAFAHAKAEIQDVMALHDVGAYVGKLYAEMDAISDRQHALRRKAEIAAAKAAKREPNAREVMRQRGYL